MNLSTIRDVAGQVGVSIATVSRVFNGSPRVSEETARRVWQAASELDYWPNSAARTLTTSRTNALGVLLPDLYGEFFSEVIRGIDQAARQQSLQVLISSSHASPVELVAAAGAMFGRVDGMIVMASDQATAEAIDRVARHFPVVLMNPPGEFPGCRGVSIDNFEGARIAVEHLLGLGHRIVGMVRGPRGNSDAEERARGCREALRRAGAGAWPTLEIDGDFTEESGYLAARAMLGHDPRPTAVFAANDAMAVGLLGALRDAGVTVPGDMAVVGFDDIAIARYLSPPLTTVSVDMSELGRRAVQLLLESFGSVEVASGRREVLPGRLVVRESCGFRRRSAPPVPGNGVAGAAA
jgi:LacI family transcriptional regulator